jgi:outer membrane protein assembly factor BamA
MFERFLLGNMQTLRGWNKYDLAPLGGSRMWNATLEYRYSDIGFFLDHGSVWDPGMAHPIRRSVGITLWRAIGLAFPLQCSRQCGAMFYINLQ